MSILIEDLYNPNNIDIEDIFIKKMKDLSFYEKRILGIENFHGYQDNTIYDVMFLNRIPLPIIYSRYKFLINNR